MSDKMRKIEKDFNEICENQQCIDCPTNEYSPYCKERFYYNKGRVDAIDDFLINIIGHFHFTSKEEEWILNMAEQLREKRNV